MYIAGPMARTSDKTTSGSNARPWCAAGCFFGCNFGVCWKQLRKAHSICIYMPHSDGNPGTGFYRKGWIRSMVSDDDLCTLCGKHFWARRLEEDQLKHTEVSNKGKRTTAETAATEAKNLLLGLLTWGVGMGCASALGSLVSVPCSWLVWWVVILYQYIGTLE